MTPEGEEMGHSEGTSSGKSRSGGLGGLGALLPGTGITGSYRQSPVMNGRISVQADRDSEDEEKKREGDIEAPESERHDEGRDRESDQPRLFRITSVGSSEFSHSGPPVNRPVIHIQTEEEGESSPLFPRMNAGQRQRAQELAGASLPPFLPPPGKGKDSPRLGSSAEPRGYGAISGGEIPVGIQTESGSRSPSRSPSPQRGSKLRKTISGTAIIFATLN